MDYEEEAELFAFDEFYDAVEADVEFECLSPEAILNAQNNKMKEISEVLHVSEEVAGKLLRHYRWNSEVLLRDYLENRRKVLKTVGIDRKMLRKGQNEANLKMGGECLICMDEIDEPSEMTALSVCL